MNKSSQRNSSPTAFVLLFVTLVLLAATVVQAQTPLLQLKASNYNPTTGLWTATVGANAQAGGTYPTLATGVSPNGAPAVVFNGGNYLTLASSIANLGGYTAIAYIKPATGAGPYALFGGASGAFEYRLYNTKQDALLQQTADLGSETTTMSTSAFSIVAVTVTNSGSGGFRLNGSADGTTAATTGFTQPISAIGARASGTGQENFSGSICELDIYPGVMTTAQIATVELAISNSYVNFSAPALQVNTTANPSVATVGGNDTLSASFSGTLPIAYQWSVATSASGTGATPITGATNTTLTLTNLTLSSTNNYYSLTATNAVSPYTASSSWLNPSVQPLTATVQLIATNYNATTGVWTDSSGNGNNATNYNTSSATLNSLVTPNGSAAVNVTSSTYFLLSNSIAAGSGYTVFTYVEPSTVAGRNSLTGGSSAGALEYDFYGGNQDYLREYQADVGHGVATISTSAFSLVDLAVNSSGATFRLNGANDATVAGSTFTSPITRVGNNEGGGDGYLGQIAEIDVYNGVLTPIQITNVEAQLTAKYVTANSVVVFPATVSPTNSIDAGTSVTLAAPVNGGTGTTTYQWQTDNASGGASFSNIGGATTTNYVLNTTSLLGTYEYQLIATPFGGSSVTSAPVTLTVNAASAPVVVTDTTITPNPASVGGNATLTATFNGTLPIGGYQWFIATDGSGTGSTPVTGATNTTLVLSNLQLTNSGYYYSLRATNVVSPYVGQSSWQQLTVNPLTAMVQLIATNYNAGSGVWTDSSGNGNNATYFGSSTPTLVPFVTPNGASAVNLTGSGSLLLSSSLDPSVGYTVIAYVEPTIVNNGSSRYALTGGSSSGALEYNFYQGNQNYLKEYVGGGGSGAATISTSAFSLVGLAVNSSGATFRLNGTNDATVAGSTFTSPITRIGNNEGSGDGYVGDIAEIDIYSGVLSSNQISNLEAQFTANYVTANSVVVGPATVSPTNNTYAGNAVTLAASVIGATGTTTYQWQTDNASGGASFSNIGGATSTNYVLNTTSLLGTYEYQLIATPFGGSSVTSAPVTLTVNAASAPVVVTDTTITPNPASVGGNASLTATFNGTLPIGGYQWFKATDGSGTGSTPITGATNTTLVLNNLQLTNSGYYYSLRATNAVSPYVGQSSWQPLTVQPLTALVQLIATNYDAVGGVWTDSSGNGNNATYSGSSIPTLVSGATPNGGAAVNLTGAGSLLLASSLDPSLGYTVIAYVEPTLTSARLALTGGSSPGALEYDIAVAVSNGNQDYLKEYQVDVGHGNATIPTSSFSLIDLAVNSSGAAFRFNGASDGTVAGSTFTSPITRIGNNEGGGDGYVGDIAEIDIYSGALSPIQITNLEAQLTAKYVTVTGPTGPATITSSVSGSTLQLTWPSGQGWRLVGETNSLSVGLTTNGWSTVPGVSDGSATITINPAQPTVFYRLVYP
jgi:hypothetical protein